MKNRTRQSLDAVAQHLWDRCHGKTLDTPIEAAYMLRFVLHRRMSDLSTTGAATLHRIFSGMESRLAIPALKILAPPPTPPLEFVPTVAAVDGGSVATIHISGEMFYRHAGPYVKAVQNAKTVYLMINSIGGDLAFAMTLIAALKGKHVEATVNGFCFSAAAILLQCANVRKMTIDSKLCLHPGVVSVVGSPAELRRVADELDTMDMDQIIPLFHRCNRTELKEWLTGGGDHYFCASESLAYGLVDEVLPMPPRPQQSEAITATATPEDDVDVVTRELLARIRSLYRGNPSRFTALLDEATK